MAKFIPLQPMEQKTIHTQISDVWKSEGGYQPTTTDFEYLKPRTLKEIMRRYRIGIYCSIIVTLLGVIFFLVVS